MTESQKKIVLVLAGIVLCVLVFFLIYQPNSEKITALEAETRKLQSDVNMLTALQVQVDQMREDSEAHEAEMDVYFAEYPSRMTEQRAIYNVYEMMVDTGIRITAIQPSRDMTFLMAGQYSGMDAAVLSDNAEAAASGAAAEISPETKVPVNEIVGKYTTYQVAFTGKKSEIMDALDWVSENPEHMSVGAFSIAFDSSTGLLTGTMAINFYSMNGNGVAYVEPDISGIDIGSDDVFGASDKGEKGEPSYSE